MFRHLKMEVDTFGGIFKSSLVPKVDFTGKNLAPVVRGEHPQVPLISNIAVATQHL